MQALEIGIRPISDAGVRGLALVSSDAAAPSYETLGK